MRRLYSALSEVVKQSESLCYMFKHKCWADTEADLRPARDYCSFCLAPQSAAYSGFNFPLCPVCKIPMRISSCRCCHAHSELDFALSKPQRGFSEISHSRGSELCGVTPGDKLTCTALYYLCLKTNHNFRAQMDVPYWGTRQ